MTSVLFLFLEKCRYFFLEVVCFLCLGKQPEGMVSFVPALLCSCMFFFCMCVCVLVSSLFSPCFSFLLGQIASDREQGLNLLLQHLASLEAAQSSPRIETFGDYRDDYREGVVGGPAMQDDPQAGAAGGGGEEESAPFAASPTAAALQPPVFRHLARVGFAAAAAAVNHGNRQAAITFSAHFVVLFRLCACGWGPFF
jgi:hypothetical protein